MSEQIGFRDLTGEIVERYVAAWIEAPLHEENVGVPCDICACPVAAAVAPHLTDEGVFALAYKIEPATLDAPPVSYTPRVRRFVALVDAWGRKARGMSSTMPPVPAAVAVGLWAAAESEAAA